MRPAPAAVTRGRFPKTREERKVCYGTEKNEHFKKETSRTENLCSG